MHTYIAPLWSNSIQFWILFRKLLNSKTVWTKSTSTRIPLSFCFSHSDKMTPFSLILPPVNLFLTKPSWSSCIIQLRVFFILFANIPLNTLYIAFINVIVLHFFHMTSIFSLSGKASNYPQSLLYCTFFKILSKRISNCTVFVVFLQSFLFLLVSLFPFCFVFWGIRRGLVVLMAGSQLWVHRFDSPLDPQNGLAWSLYRCGVLWCGPAMVLLHLKDPLELFVKRR